MENKDVKIIGLTLNNQFGILQSCKLEFDSNNNLIVVKGPVGSGKTTLQKSLKLGTLGSDTLKDKTLYGEVNQETQLLDGENKVFVGCKSDKKGNLTYVIFTKDADGKIQKDPVVDGVKLTPATYLKSLQTELTWKMDELTSENPTVQRDILLKLYKYELADLGVLFDKKSEGYSDSILGKIELAENKRAESEHARKKVGGFAKMLAPLGIFIDQPDTIPVRVELEGLEKEKNKLVYSDSTAQEAKDQKLKELKTKADAVVVEMKSLNIELVKENDKIQSEYDEQYQKHLTHNRIRDGLSMDLKSLQESKCLLDKDYSTIRNIFVNKFNNPEPSMAEFHPLIKFDADGKCISTFSEWSEKQQGFDLIVKLSQLKIDYAGALNELVGEDENKQSKIDAITEQINAGVKVNEKCEMVDSYMAWYDDNAAVLKLKMKYAELLSSVKTGVEGLNICVDKEDEKLSIYLTYNGAYDPAYFSNTDKEARKLISYSGTQKPMICLLLQNYLLSKKPKAMRYLWIDNVPIDNKTKYLMDDMAKNLDMTIIVNITGDFDHESLSSGELLLDGGEIFFK